MGKGKGHIKIRSGNRNDGKCNICGCICALCIIPPLFILAGVLIFVSGNTRVERIERYNEIAKLWNERDYSIFQNKNFKITGSIEEDFQTNTDTSGNRWPVRDACSKDDDPEEGCVSVRPMSYTTNYVYISGETINIYSNSDFILTDNIPTSKYYYYSRHDLNCDGDDDTESDCRSACRNRGGTWSGGRCSVLRYLSNVCYRLTYEEGKFYLDNPSTHLMNPTNNLGCYYGSGDFSPYTFGSSTHISVKIELRLNTDPVVIASDTTFGCSDTSPSSGSCFGMTKTEQNIIGAVLAGIGVIMIVLEITALILLCSCCKNMLQNFNCCSSNQRRASIYSTANAAPYPQTAIPIASYATPTATTATVPMASVPAGSIPTAVPTAVPAGSIPTAIPTAVPAGSIPTAVPTTSIPTTSIPTASVPIAYIPPASAINIPSSNYSSSVNAPLLDTTYSQPYKPSIV